MLLDEKHAPGLPGPGPSSAQFRAHLDRLGGSSTPTATPSDFAKRLKSSLSGLGRRRKLFLLSLVLATVGLLTLNGGSLGVGQARRVSGGLGSSSLQGGYSSLWSTGQDTPPAENEVCGLEDEDCADPVDPELLDSVPASLPPAHVSADSAPSLPRPWLSDPSAPLGTWGLSMSSSSLTAGISPILPNPVLTDDSNPALSKLGHFADNIYRLGTSDPVQYRKGLEEFVRVAFPAQIASEIQGRLGTHLDYAEGMTRLTRPHDLSNPATPVGHGGSGTGKEDERKGWRESKRIWQTDKDDRFIESSQVSTWRNGQAQKEGWDWEMVTDHIADQWIGKEFGGSRIEKMWNAFPSGILRSDTLRYLALAVRGGIYTDTDTELLKAPSSWGRGPELYKPEGWASAAQLERIKAGEGADEVFGPPSVVVGVEADVGGRSDWFDWWPRPLQIVQWTMASSPSHPIAVDAVMRILLHTGSAIDWAHTHDQTLRALWEEGKHAEARQQAKVDVLAEPKAGGPLGVISWTGPGVWTDAVLAYLRVYFGLVWTDLKDLRKPLRVGDVVVLPVTGFSPGVGNFGAEAQWTEQAMVNHLFRGTWKGNQ